MPKKSPLTGTRAQKQRVYKKRYSASGCTDLQDLAHWERDEINQIFNKKGRTDPEISRVIHRTVSAIQEKRRRTKKEAAKLGMTMPDYLLVMYQIKIEGVLY